MACASSWAGRIAAPLGAAVMSTLAIAAPSLVRVGGSASEPSVSIELRPLVRVERANVRLGDIAFLTSSDLPTLRRLMALPIGTAPRAGTLVTLDRDTIARWVEVRGGLQSVDATFGIRWSGSGETSIETAAQEMPGEAVVEAARSALVGWLSQRSVRAEVQPVSSARDLILPAGVPMLRVRPLSSQSQPSRRMLVWVDAWVDERFVRTTAVTFEVNAWASLPVATEDMRRGAQVDAVLLRGATELRVVDLTNIRQGTPVSSSAELDAGRLRLRRPLKPGEVLTIAHLEPAPAVVRGNWAHLQAGSGAVSVESRVEVLQDGRTGQLVRVKVPGSSGEVMARVTGPGRVEVQP